MKQSIVAVGDRLPSIDNRVERDAPRLFQLPYIFVLLGSLAGTICFCRGTYFFVPLEEWAGSTEISISSSLFGELYPFILSLFFATSTIGYCFFPLILFVRGFVLSLQTAFLFERSFFTAAVITTVLSSALFSLSSLLLIGSGVMFSSWRIRSGKNNDQNTVSVFPAFVLAVLSAICKSYLPLFI